MTKENGSKAVGTVRMEPVPIGRETADKLDSDRSEPEARLTGIPFLSLSECLGPGLAILHSSSILLHR